MLVHISFMLLHYGLQLSQFYQNAIVTFKVIVLRKKLDAGQTDRRTDGQPKHIIPLQTLVEA